MPAAITPTSSLGSAFSAPWIRARDHVKVTAGKAVVAIVQPNRNLRGHGLLKTRTDDIAEEHVPTGSHASTAGGIKDIVRESIVPRRGIAATRVNESIVKADAGLAAYGCETSERSTSYRFRTRWVKIEFS